MIRNEIKYGKKKKANDAIKSMSLYANSKSVSTSHASLSHCFESFFFFREYVIKVDIEIIKNKK